MDNAEKMFTFLRGYFTGAKMNESRKALSFAREKHDGQTRRSGEPYIVHPLSMASYALEIGITDDDTVAAILLHDVVEDCGVTLEHMNFNDKVKRIVKYMTKSPIDGEDKATCTNRYFHEMEDCLESILCKALDRYNNLGSSAGVMSDASIEKNVRETEEYILPLLRYVKEKRPDMSGTVLVLKTNLTTLCNALRKGKNETV